MRGDGRLVYRLNRRSRDGATRVVFEPQDFVARLTASMPPPRFHALRYHGVRAPMAAWRARIVPPLEVPEERRSSPPAAGIPRTPACLEKAKGFSVRTRTEALTIDRARKTVLVRDLESAIEEHLPYDKLVPAAGGSARRPPLPGLERRHVWHMTHPDHAGSLVREIEAQGLRRAVLVGAGLIDVERAQALVARGVGVTLVEMAPQVLPGVLDADTAPPVARHLQQKGIDVVLGERATALLGKDRVTGVQTERRTMDADFAVLAVGTRPARAWPRTPACTAIVASSPTSAAAPRTRTATPAGTASRTASSTRGPASASTCRSARPPTSTAARSPTPCAASRRRRSSSSWRNAVHSRRAQEEDDGDGRRPLRRHDVRAGCVVSASVRRRRMTLLGVLPYSALGSCPPNAARSNGASIARVHSSFIERMKRATTARLPYLPIAPKR